VKISIITVSYNSYNVILNCLESVNTQENVDVEHIVIDGASTDGTLPLLESKREQLEYLISEPDKGIYYAMNKGIELATGDIIGFLNTDDFYASSDILKKVSTLFNNNPDLDACYADLIYVNQTDTSKNIRYWKSSKFKPGLFSRGWSPPHPTFFARNSVYKRFGSFDLTYRIASDTELMMRFLEINKIKVRYIPQLWVKMRMGGTTNKSLRNILLQNGEVLSALNYHNLPVNYVSFFICKIISRGLQFLKRYKK
tara:strand:+ start:321 stop:1085 length:765 start_codon:yes stop_codon:yes gene_type:complete